MHFLFWASHSNPFGSRILFMRVCVGVHLRVCVLARECDFVFCLCTSFHPSHKLTWIFCLDRMFSFSHRRSQRPPTWLQHNQSLFATIQFYCVAQLNISLKIKAQNGVQPHNLSVSTVQAVYKLTSAPVLSRCNCGWVVRGVVILLVLILVG